MKYNVYIGNTPIGTVRTLGTKKSGHRLVNIFGTKATKGLVDKEHDCTFDINWKGVGRLRGPWVLRRA